MVDTGGLRAERARWRRLDLDAAPVDVAAAFADREGAAFLDSATAGEDGGGLSLVAADPVGLVRGRFPDTRPLEAALRSGGCRTDIGVPCGGLLGTIDYSGAYCFGEYPGFLVFDHAADEWFEAGESGLAGIGEAAGPGAAGPALLPLAFHGETSREAFLSMVGRAKDYIAAGDIYQVNLSQRFVADWPHSAAPFALYRRLRETSPSPFAAYLNLGGRQVLSSSPELFLRMSGQEIITRPIKGTRPRFRDAERDEKSAYDLITSQKEIAELVMITDLERNALGQVCQFGSVAATELLKLERFAQVFHLVSTVRGTLRPEVTHPAALAACSPGGSITGAPKKRAREIIAELEPCARGLYTGAIGYLGYNGESQFNIAIRTAVVERGQVHFHAGAGIVADSKPEAEYEETLHKAAGLLRAAGCEAGFVP